MNRFYLEQLKLGELDPVRESVLKKDPGWEQALDEINRSDAEILQEYPADRIGAQIRERMEQREQDQRIVPFGKRRYILPLFTAAAAVLLLAVGIPLLILKGGSSTAGSEITRIKGGEQNPAIVTPRLHVYRNTGSEAEELGNLAEAREGDRIQISYQVPGPAHGAIFSLDGSGTLTRHFPDNGPETAPLEHGKEILLPFAYQLDDAPRHETFILIASRRPISLDLVSEVIRAEQEPEAIRKKLVSLFGKSAITGVYSIRLNKR